MNIALPVILIALTLLLAPGQGVLLRQRNYSGVYPHTGREDSRHAESRFRRRGASG